MSLGPLNITRDIVVKNNLTIARGEWGGDSGERNHQQITMEEGEERTGSHINLNPGLIWKYN